jgi:hypothetical protein
MANPEEPNIFSPSIFWQTHSNYAEFRLTAALLRVGKNGNASQEY